MNPQTLRQYDRLGLVTPGRAGGGGRRYSSRDVALLREVQRLSQEEGVNLAGIKRMIDRHGEHAARPGAGARRGAGGLEAAEALGVSVGTPPASSVRS